MPNDDAIGTDLACQDDLIQALRSLPQAQPEGDGWPWLADALRSSAARDRRRKARRRSLWLAAAAMLLLALALPYLSQPSQRAAPVADKGLHSVAPEQHALVEQSQRLERLLASRALAPMAQDGDQVLLELGLNEHIGRIDSALAVAERDQMLPLWRARVVTLAELVEVRRLAHERDAGGQAAGLTWSN